MTDAISALRQLKEGNKRFVANSGDALAATHQPNMANGQSPFAIVVACSDSRVPTELIFDQGIGDLFVIRVAGNIVATTQIGSIEYAATELGTPLVIVLGHSHCGAVSATLSEMTSREPLGSPNFSAIVDEIRPALLPLVAAHDKATDADLLTAAVKANVMASVARLRHRSKILEALIESGDLAIVGAEYSIEDGEVRFFDGID